MVFGKGKGEWEMGNGKRETGNGELTTCVDLLDAVATTGRGL